MLERLLELAHVNVDGEMVPVSEIFNEDDKLFVEELICNKLVENYGLKWIRESDEDDYARVYNLFGLAAIQTYMRIRLK